MRLLLRWKWAFIQFYFKMCVICVFICEWQAAELNKHKWKRVKIERDRELYRETFDKRATVKNYGHPENIK